MAIENTLVLSTAHISRETTNRLIALAPNQEHDVDDLPFRFCVHYYGYIMFLSGDENYLPTIEYFEECNMPELHPIFAHAYQKGCNYINFDADADELDEFPTFEW